MFFSIVIPVYKVEKYLNRCIDSIHSQSFDDYEIILVDDGSPDGSSRISDILITKDEKISIIHKNNAGLSSARNIGINTASGKYCIFIDSDDLLNDNNTLSKLSNCICNKNYPDIVCYGTTLYDENNNLIKNRIPKEVNAPLYEKLQVLVQRNDYISPAYVKAINLDFLKNNNLYFINNLLSEDIEWSGRILECINTIEVCSESFYKRIRRKDGAITSNIGKKNIEDILSSIEQAILRIEKSSKTSNHKNIYYEYWAYQYAMLLSLAHCIENEFDYNDYLTRFNKLKWLLKYDRVLKVHCVEILVKLFGIKNTISILGIKQ